jgi:hypothetical protein
MTTTPSNYQSGEDKSQGLGDRRAQLDAGDQSNATDEGIQAIGQEILNNPFLIESPIYRAWLMFQILVEAKARFDGTSKIPFDYLAKESFRAVRAFENAKNAINKE